MRPAFKNKPTKVFQAGPTRSASQALVTVLMIGQLLLLSSTGYCRETIVVPTITNLCQLREAESFQGAVLPIQLEAVVCWMSLAEGRLVLQDGGCAIPIEMALGSQPCRPGDRVVIQGKGRWEGAKFNLQPIPLVDNDGLHDVTEKSGTVFLTPGKHAIRVAWFNAFSSGGLDVTFQGPGMPRQSIPDAALFRASVVPGGKTNWLPGLSFRCYEGQFERMLNFGWQVPSKQGHSSNFNANVATRTNDVALEFVGYLEVAQPGSYTFFTTSDDGSQLSVDEVPTRIQVIATNTFPKPRKIILGESAAAEDFLWSEIEGKVTFVGKTSQGWNMELSSAAGRIQVRLGEVPGSFASLLHRSQVQLLGVSENLHAAPDEAVIGQLFVPGADQVRFLSIAPEHWTTRPTIRIVDLLRPPDAQARPRIERVRGAIRSRVDAHRIIVADASGEIPVTLAQPIDSEESSEIEILGEWVQSETGIALRNALWRTAPESEVFADEELKVLTSVEQIQDLKRAQAEAEPPVRVKGVVTCSWLSKDGVLQDSRRGIYVEGLAPGGAHLLQIGDYLEVEGVVAPGSFAPFIKAQRVKVLGRAQSPEPIQPTWDQLVNGSLDCQYVELEGIVTSVGTNSLKLLLREGSLEVQLDELERKHQFLDARVRIRGCLLANWDDTTHQVISGSVQMRTASISIDAPASSDPFAAPPKQISELLQFDARAGAFQRVKVAGTIVHARQNEFFLTDGKLGLRFLARTPEQLKAGDNVEVVGLPELSGPSPLLRDALVRKTGIAPLPLARRLAEDGMLSMSNDATVVELESRLVNAGSNQFDQVLELQAGHRTFIARLGQDRGRMPPIPVGSQLKLIGVYAGRGSRQASAEVESFEVLLNSPTNIEVLHRPSWWTIKHTYSVVGGLLVVLLLAGAWISGLRRRVEQRTVQLKQEIDERERTAEELLRRTKALEKEIEERKQMQAEVERIHQQLLQASRQAGMAEIATNVLHNVGNVLNSVNTSASVVGERLRASKADGVARVAELLEQHRHDLPGYFAVSGRAEQFINFLRTLAQHLTSERKISLEELAELANHIAHIKQIVSMQQSYARVAGVAETISVLELVEDALRMNDGALARHDVHLVRDFPPHLPPITVDKHKVLQVLVNLIRNAKYACDDSSQPDKRLTVRVVNGDDRVRIAVIDNGVGIPSENLTRIFSHGFTTRKNGHGFGLHSGALAANELGGSLTAHSDGAGRGATFTLELPICPKAQTNRSEHPQATTPEFAV